MLSLPAGTTKYAVELSTVHGSLLIRVKDCDVLDLLPLSPRAADRLMKCLATSEGEQEAWNSFLTRPSSMEQALALAEKIIDRK
jgi:hypothetical protein